MNSSTIETVQAGTGSTDAHFVGLTKWFCNATVCPVINGASHI
jgi:hypothetical protein